MSIGHLLFGFQGRANRLQFWLGQLALLVLMVGLAVMAYFGFISAAGATTPQALLGAIGILFLVYVAFMVLAAWLSWAVAVKRLHDRNKSGSWLMITLAPTVLVVWTLFTQGLAALPQLGSQPLLIVLQIAVSGWYLIELGILKGTPGGNMYGPPPGGSEGFESGFDDLFHDESAAVVAPAGPQQAARVTPAAPARPVVQKMVKQPTAGRHPHAFGRRGSHA